MYHQHLSLDIIRSLPCFNYLPRGFRVCQLTVQCGTSVCGTETILAHCTTFINSSAFRRSLRGTWNRITYARCLFRDPQFWILGLLSRFKTDSCLLEMEFVFRLNVIVGTCFAYVWVSVLRTVLLTIDDRASWYTLLNKVALIPSHRNAQPLNTHKRILVEKTISSRFRWLRSNSHYKL